MNEATNKSEIARLRERIELEYQAAQWALTGLAMGTARHDFINQRMERMGECHAKLAQVVGAQEATRIVCDTVKDL